MKVEEAILLYSLIKKKNKPAKRTERIYWVHPIVQSRNEKGHFTCLFTDLLKSEQKFFNYFRMSSKSFFELHDLIKRSVKKETTNMRRPISTKERLAVTLR